MSGGQYNPLDKLNLGRSVADALLQKEARSLAGLESFDGAGIYAIYYSGDHPAYRGLKPANLDSPSAPIYIGKAIPSGGRKGASIFSDIAGLFLFNRLREHAESINQAGNLELADFKVRWLVVDDIWIPLGETLLISKFLPVWNLALDGFGNHDPGKGRYQGERPMWDTLHPGRAWALKCQPRSESAELLQGRVARFLQTAGISRDPEPI